MAPLNVLVVGGGIAGPALAHWLSRTGAIITLIERSPHIRASGQQVDLRAQGVPMMKKMGIEAAVRAVTVHETGTQLIDRQGRIKAFFPANQSGTGRQSFISEYEIMRGDLVRIFFTQDEESNANGKVHVIFQDGSKEDFDLVVGADGTGSKTRRMMLGPNAPDPRYSLGGYIAYFSIPSKPEDSDRKDRPDLTRIYMLVRGKDAAIDAAHKSGNLTELKTAWGDLYQDGGWQCDRFMEALQHNPEADDLYSTPLVEVRLPKGSWSNGRVVLIGDSAHSETGGGLGSTWALIGSYILAGDIATLYDKDRSSPTAAVVQGAQIYEEFF